ncbi:HEAT repeat domain-containing protein [Streptomyces sp. NPDC015171]|uniref:HEAT repeat domain-containing protein n=1 Tax=Streptomyces sp. NPDC015171 TaxID=3364945 RepID=UPI0036F96750
MRAGGQAIGPVVTGSVEYGPMTSGTPGEAEGAGPPPAWFRLTFTQWQGLHCAEEVVPMIMSKEDTNTMRALRELKSDSSSVRLRAALTLGTAPDPGFIGRLIERCAVEPEFSVREMLTWALTRHPASMTVPVLLGEVRSESAQARSQALHTLSKIGDRQAWPGIAPALLSDADDEVARSAWRAAVALVPEDAKGELAVVLAGQLGRGEHETQLSLSRALVALGEAMLPALGAATTDPDPRVRAHALATDRLWRDPDAGFGFAIEGAKRVVALGGAGRKGQ